MQWRNARKVGLVQELRAPTSLGGPRVPAARMLENGNILSNKYFLYLKTHISPMK